MNNNSGHPGTLSRSTLRGACVAAFFTVVAGCPEGSVEPPVPSGLTKLAGDSQTGTVGAPLATPVKVRVTDQRGEPMKGVRVTWTVEGKGGALNPASGATDGDGMSAVTWTLGTQAGVQTAGASVASLPRASFRATAQPDRPAVVTLEPTDTILRAVGESVQLTVAVADRHGNTIEGPVLDWTSSADSVAYVDANGLVTADGVGQARIAAIADTARGTMIVRVQQAVAAVSVSPASRRVVSGTAAQFEAGAFDGRGNFISSVEFLWASSDTAVASVDTVGVATARNTGSATITATTEGVSGEASLAVEPGPVEHLDISPDPVSFTALGETRQIAAVAKDAHGNVVSNPDIVWSSSDAGVATVDADALVTAAGNGWAFIAGEVGDVRDSARADVVQVAVAVEVFPALDTVDVGEIRQFTAKARDANNYELASPAVAWSSSAPDVADVDSAGLATGMAAGAATLTARVGDGSGRATVVVREAAAPSLAWGLSACCLDDGSGCLKKEAIYAANGFLEYFRAYNAFEASGSGEVTLSVQSVVNGLADSMSVTVTDGLSYLVLYRFYSDVCAADPLSPFYCTTRDTLTFNPGGSEVVESYTRGVEQLWGLEAMRCPLDGGPPPPTDFRVGGATPTSLTLTWTHNGNAERFQLDRAEEAGVGRTGQAPGEFYRVASLAGGSEEYVDGGLAPGSVHWYRLTACLGDVCSFPVWSGRVQVPETGGSAGERTYR